MPTLLGFHPESHSAQGDWKKAKVNYKYIVQADNLDQDGGVIITQTAGLPVLYPIPTAHATYAGMFALDMKAERLKGNSLIWVVDVEFGLPDPKERNGEVLDMTPTMSIDWDDKEVPALCVWLSGSGRIRDREIRNSAGERLLAKMEVGNLVLEIKKNYDLNTYNLLTALNLKDTINNASWLGFARHRAKITGVKPLTKTSPPDDDGNTFQYYELCFNIKIRDTWNVELLDEGSYYKDQDGKYKEFTTKGGHARRGLLDGSGKPLGGYSSSGITTLGGVFLPPKQVLLERDFSVMNLPTDLADFIFV